MRLLNVKFVVTLDETQVCGHVLALFRDGQCLVTLAPRVGMTYYEVAEMYDALTDARERKDLWLHGYLSRCTARVPLAEMRLDITYQGVLKWKYTHRFSETQKNIERVNRALASIEYVNHINSLGIL